MGFFGLFGRDKPKPKRSANLQDRLDELVIAERTLRLDERRESGALLKSAIEQGRTDLLPGIELYRPGRRSKATVVIPPREPDRNEHIVDVLLARALEDPSTRMARMRREALEEKALRKELNDDDEDGGRKGGILRDLLPLLPIALIALNPQAAGSILPMLQQMNGADAPAALPEPAPAPVQQPVPTEPPTSEVPLSSASTPRTPAGPEPEPQSAGGNVISSLKPSIVLQALERMDPATFASWVMNQPNGWQFVEMLANQKGDLRTLLDQYQNNPLVAATGWRPVIDWLKAHPAEAEQVVTALREAWEAEQAI